MTRYVRCAVVIERPVQTRLHHVANRSLRHLTRLGARETAVRVPCLEIDPLVTLDLHGQRRFACSAAQVEVGERRA